MQIKEIALEIETLEKQLHTISMELEKLKKQLPENGRLHALRHGKTYQYYIRTPKDREPGKYIKKRDRATAANLAQLEYDERLIEHLHKRIRDLNMLNTLSSDPFEAAFDQMAPGKKELIDPHYLSDEAYLRKWRDQTYAKMDFDEKAPEYYTRQGIRVRSKSEILIADILDEMSVPFLYEKPLLLSSGIYHPDFTLLNIKERKEVYWEHFGMMDDMDYRNNAFKKIRKYEASGLFCPDSFIWTMETGRFPLDTKNLRRMVKEMKSSMGY